MITKDEQIMYEVGSSGLIASFIYQWFPKLFRSRLKKRWKRYSEFAELLKQIESKKQLKEAIYGK